VTVKKLSQGDLPRSSPTFSTPSVKLRRTQCEHISSASPQ
jgi:hypothetical protein